MGTTGRHARRLGGLTLAVLALSSCGSDGPGAGGSGSENPTATVSTRQVDQGTVLVDANGRTLYFTDQDTESSIACVDDCARIWTALTVPAGTTPVAAPGLPGTLGAMARPDGATQVTYDGKPLYTFTLDQGAGAVSGDGLSDNFGPTTFTWHAIFTSGSGGGDDVPTAPPDYSY